MGERKPTEKCNTVKIETQEKEETWSLKREDMRERGAKVNRHREYMIKTSWQWLH